MTKAATRQSCFWWLVILIESSLVIIYPLILYEYYSLDRVEELPEATRFSRAPTGDDCPILHAPQKTQRNARGKFSYITSYYFDRPSSSLYVLALGDKFFNPTEGKNNAAKNVSFNLEDLASPLELFGICRIGKSVSKCTAVATATKDVSMGGKMIMMKCTFHQAISKQTEYAHLSSVHPSISGNRKLCIRLELNGPQGQLAKLSTRPTRPESPVVGPTLSLCIGGIRNFSSLAVDVLTAEMKSLGPAHVYLGLNTEDLQVIGQYQASLGGVISTRKLTLTPAPLKQKDVEFTQGKLPFYNECLFHAKSHQDTFLGIWDMDEMVLVAEDDAWVSNVAVKLLETKPDIVQSTCFIKLGAETFFDDSTVHSSVQGFNRRALRYCGNYTKAISVVARVDFVGNHLPESCDLYPKGRRFSSQSAKFVYSATQLRLFHLVQLWDPERFTSICPRERDDSLAERLGKLAKLDL